MRRSTKALEDSSELLVIGLSLLIAFCAGFLYFGPISGLSEIDAPFQIPLWALMALVAAGEVAFVHIQLRREAVISAMTEIPVVVGLYFTAPSSLVLAYVLGGLLTMVFHQRLPARKLAFNLAQLSLQVSVAIFLFRLILGTADPVGPMGWLATFAAMIGFDVVGAVCVTAVIALTETGRTSWQLLGMPAIASFVNTAMGLTVATSLWVRRDAAWLLLFPAVLLYLAYRAYTNQRRKHDSLESLYHSTRVLQGSLGEQSVMHQLLDQSRRMMKSEVAEIILLPPGEERNGIRSLLGPGDVERTQHMRLDPTRGVWARVASEGHGLLIVPPIENDNLRKHFEKDGITDAIVAPLFGDEGKVVGTLLVGNRLGDVGVFDHQDLKMLETLAAHAGVSLEKGRLVESLQRQAAENEYLARHDPLTRLLNRAHFRERVSAQLDAGEDVPMSAIMLMDLDRFKEINDTLGHQVGDLMLAEIAGRLRAVLPEEVQIARLGGDEFAIYLPSIERVQDAMRRAAYVTEALRRPFVVEDIKIDVAGSIGVTVHPLHGRDVDSLMQRADVAMYVAKRRHSGCELYSPGQDSYSPGRLALAGELREAIEKGDLKVHYQPILDLHESRVVGAEVLARWNHPVNGPVPPSEFIPLAEHTGLIHSMTTSVLRQSISQCSAWRQLDPNFFVAVNLSTRSLMDETLTSEIGAILDEEDLPASCLHLEITESSIMEDPDRASALLSELNQMGISLAVDDFGTGHSSLAYLKRLPVGYLKIDRAFVLGMEHDENDAIIVRSTIDLGRNLGLHVVAEGIESAPVQESLAEMGCSFGQGYHIGKPMASEKMSSWLVAHRSVHHRRGLALLRTEDERRTASRDR
jgi:diguanylate cyclase (GGDEF)-like protein